MTTTRHLVRTMIEQEFDGLDEYSVPEVVAAITQRIKTDEDLYLSYVDEALRTMIHAEALAVIHRQRIRNRQVADLEATLLAPPAPSASTLRPLGQRTARRPGFRWLSHAEPIGKRHVKLMAMTRAQIDLAISFRAHQRAGHDRRIRFLEAIREGVTEGTSVGAVYTAEHLEAIYQAIRLGQPIPAAEPAVETVAS